MATLYVHDTAGYRAANAQDILHGAQGVMARRFRRGSPVLSSPSVTREFLQVHLGALEHEVFGLLYLDAHYKLIRMEDLFRGTVDSAAVHAREIIKRALACNASALVCYHNHPSGSLEPSPADELLTRRLREALALVEIRLLDHLIVGDGICSLAERGLV